MADSSSTLYESRQWRIDLSDALERPRFLPDGTAILSGRAARIGDHEYSWGTERRDIDELQSIARQLPGRPLTVGHPPTMLRKGGRAPTAGSVKRADVRGDHAEVDMHVNETGLLAMRQGQKYLSLGYEAEVVAGRQTQTRVDHLALVSAARCGVSCSIRTDCSGGGCGCHVEIEIQPAPEVRVLHYLTAMAAAGV